MIVQTTAPVLGITYSNLSIMLNCAMFAGNVRIKRLMIHQPFIMEICSTHCHNLHKPKKLISSIMQQVPVLKIIPVRYDSTLPHDMLFFYMWEDFHVEKHFQTSNNLSCTMRQKKWSILLLNCYYQKFFSTSSANDKTPHLFQTILMNLILLYFFKKDILILNEIAVCERFYRIS